MITIKQVMLLVILLLELAIFAVVYLFGSHGIKQFEKAQQENSRLQREVTNVREEVAKLQDKLVAWHQDDYHKEKMARERLQLAKPNEQIYHII